MDHSSLLLVIDGEQLPCQKSETAPWVINLILMYFCKQWLNYFILIGSFKYFPSSIIHHNFSDKNDWLAYTYKFYFSPLIYSSTS